MTHWQRVVLAANWIAMILVFIVFLTRVVAEFFDAGADLAIGNPGNEFNTVWVLLQEISFWLMVPIFILTVILYLVFGPAQEELQKERQRRGL